MIENIFDLLTLSNEAAVCTRGSVIRFANAPARALLGDGCVGRSLRSLFGEELEAVQSANFITDFAVNGKRCTARFVRIENGSLIFLSSASADPAILNDPLLFSLRSSLMNLGIVTDSLRTMAEDRDEGPLRRSIASLTVCYYRLMRQVENAGFALELLRGEEMLNAFPVDLQSICAAAVEAIRGFFPQIQIEYEAEGGSLVTADPALFKLMLNNLLGNCLVHANCRHIRVRLSETPGSLLLSVTDDGCGIPSDRLHQAFDRFRYPFDAEQMGRGSGLGLTAARGAAKLHGGALLLESREGRGTAVRVTISRNLSGHSRLREDADSACYTSRDLLTGLADCLPEDAFSDRFLD